MVPLSAGCGRRAGAHERGDVVTQEVGVTGVTGFVYNPCEYVCRETRKEWEAHP